MALSEYALVSTEEAKLRLQVTGPQKAALIDQIVNRASELVEQFFDRQIVTRGEVTEYHNPVAGMMKLYTLDRPVISISSIHESTAWPRVYDADSALTADEDYQLLSTRGVLRRIGSGGPRCWAPGIRTVRLVGSFGYQNTAAVPERIKAPTLELCALFWAEATRGQDGISGASDEHGNWSRFSAAGITPEIEKKLAGEQRVHEGLETAERVA